jgi:hypothetical protein
VQGDLCSNFSNAIKTIKSKRRGIMTVLGWTISLGTSLWTSHHEFLATGAAALALLWPIILFWPEIKLLRIAYPKNTIKLESPAWLYVFGVVSLGALLLASYRVYSSTSVAPRTLTADEFAQPLISGKFFCLADFADQTILSPEER